MSGIGPAALLRDLGIEVRHDLPGVGENLQDHWMLRVQHRLENTVTLSGWMNSLVGKAALGLQYFLTRRGPLSAQPTLLAVFARTLPGLDIPDVQIHVSAASYAHVGGPLHPFPGMTSSACILRPTSRGHVRIRSLSPRTRLPSGIISWRQCTIRISRSARWNLCAASSRNPLSNAFVRRN